MYNNGFTLIVVLFILLIIVGAYYGRGFTPVSSCGPVC